MSHHFPGAASWNPVAAEAAARVAAVEASAHGLHWTFAPMVDIARDPRWGRIVEGAGEDPYLGSLMAAARVRGFQGSQLGAPNTMLATAKHFVAYGAAEGGRDYNTAAVSERTARGYLPPFHASVKAGVESVMGALNEIAGVPLHANRPLLTDVLREWGFEGVLVSDWTAIPEMIQHGRAATRAEAGLAALHAGKKMPALVREGRASEAAVDVAVRRVLRAKFELGLFEDPRESIVR
ncbi:MAG: glycoside hydrolase family 3 protein [Gemmatimonadota bacterium]